MRRLALLAPLLLCACAPKAPEYTDSPRFERVLRKKVAWQTALYVFRDRETGVEYLAIVGAHGCGICKLEPATGVQR